MNARLREEHFETLASPIAKEAYDMLLDACEKREGGATDADQMLIYNYARAEDIKQICIEDMAKHGLGTERYNGRQHYFQENKAIGHERASAEQQRKILVELRLTPQARKALPVSIDEDAFENF